MPVCIDTKHGHMIDIDWPGVYSDDGSRCFDLRAVVDIVTYTKWILEQTSEKQLACAEAVDTLLEIRGWFWEYYLVNASKEQSEMVSGDMRKAVLEYVKPIVAMLDLSISED